MKRIQPRGGKLEGRRVAANGDADYRPGGRTSLAKELSYFEKVKQRWVPFPRNFTRFASKLNQKVSVKTGAERRISHAFTMTLVLI